MIEALLFDLDGTILDTTELIVESFLFTFRQGLGKTVSRQSVMEHFGMSLDDEFLAMCPSLSVGQIENLVALYRRHNRAHHDQMVSLVPGADEVLRKLEHQGLPLAVVTSKRQDMAEHGLKLFGLDKIFATIVHHDSTSQHKPHPEPLYYALEALGVSSQNAWYVGDSPYDMIAAKMAGCLAIGFSYNTFGVEELMESGANSIVYSWPELYALWQTNMSTGDSENPGAKAD